MNIAELSQEDQLTFAKAIWMTAIRAALTTLREDGVTNETTVVSMIEVMTEVVSMLLKKDEE